MDLQRAEIDYFVIKYLQPTTRKTLFMREILNYFNVGPEAYFISSSENKFFYNLAEDGIDLKIQNHYF